MALGVVSAMLLMGGCGNGADNGTDGAADSGADSGAGSQDPKGALAAHLTALQAGDAAGLKAGFTPRLRAKVTPELVKAGQAEAAKFTLDELVASVQMSEDKKTAKLKMKNGRTLTTMILTDGKWLADTIWFR